MAIEDDIEAALFRHVQELELDDFPVGIPTAWPNDQFPQDGQQKPPTYIEVLHHRNKINRFYMKGSNPHLRQGILQITLFTPISEGTEPSTLLAGAIAEQFPADLALFQGSTKVRIQQAPDVGNGDKTPDGVSWAVVISVRYDCLA